MIRRFARDAGLACVAAAAVVAGYRLARPAAGPTVADATDALDAAADGGSFVNSAVDSAGGWAGAEAAALRVYDVRDLLRGPLAYRASQGKADGPGGYWVDAKPWGGFAGNGATETSIRDEAADKLIDLLEDLAVVPSQNYVSRQRWFSTAGGRLFITLPAADQARVGAMLDALRLAERARPGWRVEAR